MNTFGFSYGAFGELLQGVLSNDRHFLVNLPINIKSKAYFNPQSSKKFIVYPKFKEKIKNFINLFCNYYGIVAGGYLSIESEIPIGKGLSSSTADLIILGIDEGGEVDTIRYNQVKQNPSIQEKYEFKKLLSQFIQAISEKDLNTIGKISTRSTELNQKYNYKPSFNNILEINCAINGLGLICAHGETYVRVLLNKFDIDLNSKINYCRQVCSKLNMKIELFHTVEEVSYAAMC